MNLKKIYRRTSLFLISIIIISNIPFVSWIIDSCFGMDYYAYSNGDGTWTGGGTSFKEKPYPNIMTLSTTEIDSRVYGAKPVGVELRELYPNADTIIYRLFWKNPLVFWHWWQYIGMDHRYDFPYKSWEEIQARRPPNFRRSGKWQQF